MSLLVLSASDVRKVVSLFSTTFLQELMGRVFTAISQLSSSDEAPIVQTPHRTTIDMRSHTTLFMPARISSSRGPLEGTSIKVVSIPRSAHDMRGLPATTLVLNEETGAVEAVVNARELTALRNAAGSLLSTTLVGIQKPQHIVLFGAGKQIEAHLNIFLRHYPTISSCTIVNRNLNERALDLYKSATTTFQRVIFHLFAQNNESSVQNAVQMADIIICATSSTAPLFPSSWVSTGAHVVLVGSYKPHMQEIEEALVQRAIPSTRPCIGQRINQSIIVDSREACAKEAGDLIKAGVDQGSMIEIGELLLQARDRSLAELMSEGPDERASAPPSDTTASTAPITIFKSVGVGLQDVAMAKEVVSHAKNAPGVGTLIKGYDMAI